MRSVMKSDAHCEHTSINLLRDHHIFQFSFVSKVLYIVAIVAVHCKQELLLKTHFKGAKM